MRPKLLDLYCGAGGSAVGYFRAGFDVIGVDHKPQKRYPFPMVVADALRPPFDLSTFAAIHASPPCQAYSVARVIHGREHPDLVPATRALLESSGVPWIMENVPGAPLIDPVTLCGTMFDLKVFRHRLFESSILLMAPPHEKHNGTAVEYGKPLIEGRYVTVSGHFSGIEIAKRAMGIDWMARDELSQAIPPVFTHYLGIQLMRAIQ